LLVSSQYLIRNVPIVISYTDCEDWLVCLVPLTGLTRFKLRIRAQSMLEPLSRLSNPCLSIESSDLTQEIVGLLQTSRPLVSVHYHSPR
jgi:hypothetical protein